MSYAPMFPQAFPVKRSIIKSVVQTNQGFTIIGGSPYEPIISALISLHPFVITIEYISSSRHPS